MNHNKKQVDYTLYEAGRQLKLPMETEIFIAADDPVRLVSAVVERMEIERACRENICFIYLLGDYPAPDHNTIARFRGERLAGSEKELLEQFVELLAEWGFVSLATVFIDGTKIEANANRYTRSFPLRNT